MPLIAQLPSRSRALIVVVLIGAPLAIFLLVKAGKIPKEQRAELLKRYLSWLVIVPLMLGPILLGTFWTIAAVVVLGLLCHQEFARATGLFRERIMSLMVVLGILAVGFASVDNWYYLFVALTPLTIAVIAGVAVFADQPKGYIQRVALAVLSFLLFGTCIGHLGYIANDADYRPILILVLMAVELNDVFGYVVGKSFGKGKLAPNTSPNKTVAGALGALILTTAFVAVVGYFVFAETALENPIHLVALGLLISAGGQLGDLVLSSIKRDLGIKDMSAAIPGHGGLLDRFDSVILVAPAVFHYVNYFRGVGVGEPVRLFTGG